MGRPSYSSSEKMDARSIHADQFVFLGAEAQLSGGIDGVGAVAGVDAFQQMVPAVII